MTSKRPFVVGIAGGSASGKSTLAAALVETLAASDPPLTARVVAMDHYARRDDPRGPRFIYAPSGEEMFDMNRPESFDTERLAADIEGAQECDVLIVEGLMVLQAPAIRERLDLRLFVELDADERALRRMIRNMSGERGNRDPQFIAGYYRQSARVGHAQWIEPSRVHADLILRGDADLARIAPMIAAVVAAGGPQRVCLICET